MEELKKIDLYFTVTTGRSGTAFLAKYISDLGNICALHEPVPQFHPIMRQALTDYAVAENFWKKEKAPAILKLGQKKYVETSHLICKGFLEPLFAAGIYPNLILLKRTNRDVAKSMYYINSIPGRTESGLKYFLKPDDPGNLLHVQNWECMSDYQLCYWYTLEIEKRQTYYADRVLSNGGRVMHLDFNELMRGKKHDDLRNFLGLPPAGFINNLLMKMRSRIKINSKFRRKIRKILASSVSFDQEERQLMEMLKL